MELARQRWNRVECVSLANQSAAGHHVDVLEIDAASHTGVDDAREIIEGVDIVRYQLDKIYIIDEVHMMSKSAFNAMLKTLKNHLMQ